MLSFVSVPVSNSPFRSSCVSDPACSQLCGLNLAPVVVGPAPITPGTRVHDAAAVHFQPWQSQQQLISVQGRCLAG